MCAVWVDGRDGQKIDGKTKLKMNPSCADAGFNWIARPCLEKVQYISPLFAHHLPTSHPKLDSSLHFPTLHSEVLRKCVVLLYSNVGQLTWEAFLRMSEVLPSRSEFWRTMKYGALGLGNPSMDRFRDRIDCEQSTSITIIACAIITLPKIIITALSFQKAHWLTGQGGMFSLKSERWYLRNSSWARLSWSERWLLMFRTWSDKSETWSGKTWICHAGGKE